MRDRIVVIELESHCQ